MEQQEKLKISSDFIFAKILFAGLAILLLLLLTDYKVLKTEVVLNYVIILIVSISILYYLFTRPKIYYSDSKMVIEKSGSEVDEVPFSEILSIRFSVIGFRQGGHSYRIKYRAGENKIHSVRLFPSIFENSTFDFIKCVERKNKKVIVTNGSLGINEFFE